MRPKGSARDENNSTGLMEKTSMLSELILQCRQKFTIIKADNTLWAEAPSNLVDRQIQLYIAAAKSSIEIFDRLSSSYIVQDIILPTCNKSLILNKLEKEKESKVKLN